MATMPFDHTNRDNFVLLLEASEGLGEQGSCKGQVYARSEDNKHAAQGQRRHEWEMPQTTTKQECRSSQNTRVNRVWYKGLTSSLKLE